MILCIASHCLCALVAHNMTGTSFVWIECTPRLEQSAAFLVEKLHVPTFVPTRLVIRNSEWQ